MNPTCVYPASFCPPTYGHFHTLTKAAELFPEVTLVCSVNPDKTSQWFSPEESKHLWQTYALPPNVGVKTFAEFMQEKRDPSAIVMVRGIRDENDAEYEKKVMLFNKARFGIGKYFYLFSDDEFKEISSSSVRTATQQMDLQKLAGCVSPLVVSRLLEKTLDLENLFMVVGRPGSGKSTFLKTLVGLSTQNIWVNTDDFNHQLKPLLQSTFGEEDLTKVALEREEELKEVIAEQWLDLLKDALRKLPSRSNVFLEIPFGMQPDKRMFRFVGGKILYLGCAENRAEQRVVARGTPHLVPFIKRIPNRAETERIAREQRLSLLIVETDCSLTELQKTALKFHGYLNEEKTKWKTPSPGSCLDIS